MSRYLDGLNRHRSGRLSCVDAADLLGVSERHFRRLRDRYEADGAEGLIDRRRGRKSGRRAAVDRIEFVLEQYCTRYFDFTVKHFHDALCEQGFDLSYTWTKTVLQQRGLVPVSTKRSAHREKRVRRPLPGIVCAFTTDEAEAPLFRLPVKPNERNGLRATCRLMVDKITTVPKSKVGSRLGRLDDEDILRLHQAVLVFLGLAVSPRTRQQEA